MSSIPDSEPRGCNCVWLLITSLLQRGESAASVTAAIVGGAARGPLGPADVPVSLGHSPRRSTERPKSNHTDEFAESVGLDF